MDGELFDEIAQTTTELEVSKSEFSRLHAAFRDQLGLGGDHALAMDLSHEANEMYARWSAAAFRLLELQRLVRGC